MTSPPPPGVRYVREDTAALVGARVVLRRRLGDGATGDVLGVLLRAADGVLEVDARTGVVEVAEADVLALKAVPPPPARRR